MIINGRSTLGECRPYFLDETENNHGLVMINMDVIGIGDLIEPSLAVERFSVQNIPWDLTFFSTRGYICLPLRIRLRELVFTPHMTGDSALLDDLKDLHPGDYLPGLFPMGKFLFDGLAYIWTYNQFHYLWLDNDYMRLWVFQTAEGLGKYFLEVYRE